MINVLKMYITLLPVILGGIGNMLFVKTVFYKKHRKPIDGGKNIFGNNKTWIGAFSMIIQVTIFQILVSYTPLTKYNFIYERNENCLPFNLMIGLLLGTAYILFELPNSFIKRRLKIAPGETKNWGSYLGDQIDSIIGVTVILCFYTDMTILKFFGYLVLGALTHSVINLVLYTVKIRKNI